MIGLGLGLGFGSAQAAFTPTQLASLVAWYRGDNVVLDGSNNLQTLKDKSTNALDATQSSAGSRPAYAANGGLGYFTSSTGTGLQAAGFPTLATFEAFLVLRAASSTPGANGYLFDSGAGNATAVFQKSTTGIVALYTGAEVNGPQLTAADHVVNFAFDGGASNGSFVAIDGGTPTTGTLSAVSLATPLTLGNYGGGFSFGYAGRFYESIVCGPGLLSVSDRAKTVAYLKARYGIT